MYEGFFGLSESPFNMTPDPRFVYLSRHHQAALSAMCYGVNRRSGFIQITGEIGAGKTTLLKMLSGILYPTSGEARVLGFTPWERHREYQRQFAIVMGQKNQLWWDLPPAESFLLNRDIYGVDHAEFQRTIDEMVELLDLKDLLNIPVRQLSLGQRMKCELVASLLHQPRVLFLV